jgi:hypothetical protein
MSETFYNSKLRPSIEAIIKPYENYQKYKNVQCGHGQTAPREAGLLLWSAIAVDMIGPTLEVGSQTENFSALMIIDLVTHLIKIVRVNNTATATVAAHFGNAWFTRYPARLELLHCNNIQSHCTTTKNYKQMHPLCS